MGEWRNGQQHHNRGERKTAYARIRGTTDQVGQGSPGKQQQRRNDWIGITKEDRTAAADDEEIRQQEHQQDPVGWLPAPRGVPDADHTHQHQHRIDPEPESNRQLHPTDSRRRGGGQVLKDVAEAVLGHGRIEHEER